MESTYENRGATATVANPGIGILNTSNNSYPALPSPAVLWVAKRFRITIPHARVVCELYGLGGAA